jgi:hypothetical protein
MAGTEVQQVVTLALVRCKHDAVVVAGSRVVLAMSSGSQGFRFLHRVPSGVPEFQGRLLKKQVEA